MRRGRVAFLLAVAAAAALAFAGCGGDDDGDGGSGDVTAFCDKVAELQSMPDPFAEVGQGDVEGIQDAVDTTREAAQEALDAAPDEISADAQQLVDAFDQLAEDLGGAETPEELLQAASGLQEQATELEAAGQRVEDYANENCGEA